MSDTTFQELWRGLKLYAAELPVPLAQRFVNIAYTRAIRANEWSQLKGNGEWYIPAPYSTGTVTIADGDTVVVGSGTTFTSDMVGRQIMLANQGVPWYDIIGFTDTTHITLDRAYSGLDLSGDEFEINQIYVEAPSDFDFFISVLDPEREWKLHFNIEQVVIDAWDPKRQKVGDVWLIAPAGPKVDADGTKNSARHRFEVWPRAGSARRIPFRFQKKVNQLTAVGDVPIWPLKGDVITEGALARLAMYKGEKDAPNEYYDLSLYRFHQENFLRELHRAAMEDQRVSQTWVAYADTEDWPFAPIDGAYLQSHDVGIMTRWGFGY